MVQRTDGFPAEASGLLVTGSSAANLVALTVARDLKGGVAVAESGLASGTAMTMYASDQTHSSIDKAARLLGLGRSGLRKIAVDDRYRLDMAALRLAIREDRAKGRQPICVVGNAGTVNTGAIDDLPAIAEICAAEGLWFHVDGAFGAICALSDELKGRVTGMERADSLAFSLHKWLHVPYEAGCVLIRDRAAHESSSFNT